MLTEITGVTGQAILRTILDGERDPLKLASCATRPVSLPLICAKALTGTWRAEQGLIRQQAVEWSDGDTAQIR